jgi:hypothetical protein
MIVKKYLMNAVNYEINNINSLIWITQIYKGKNFIIAKKIYIFNWV